MISFFLKEPMFILYVMENDLFLEMFLAGLFFGVLFFFFYFCIYLPVEYFQKNYFMGG